MTKSQLFSWVLLAASVAGCSSTGEPSHTAGLPGAQDPNASADSPQKGTATEAPSASPSGGSSSASSSQPGGVQAQGTLTAGVWDDNLNFDFFKGYLGDLAKPRAAGSAATQPNAVPIFSATDREAAHTRFATRASKTELDVAILLDTTSSMSDETAYLQKELAAITTAIQSKFPGVTPRFGLTVYRDYQDEYVTRSVPFTTDVQAFGASLAAQSAAGGGDLPEAVAEGLSSAVALDWRATDNVAKLVFWVADAPHHPGTEADVRTAVTAAAQKGIHVYPVAASGATSDAELVMRETAQVTGGRYLFLTDDSGIGDSHAEPHIPCYRVTSLKSAMVRMVESEIRGLRVEAAETEVLRTVGSPSDGTCTLKDTSRVTLY
jgi:hypothetical protein